MAALLVLLLTERADLAELEPPIAAVAGQGGMPELAAILQLGTLAKLALAVLAVGVAEDIYTALRYAVAAEVAVLAF